MLHFLRPLHIMNLVEVLCGQTLLSSMTAQLTALVQSDIFYVLFAINREAARPETSRPGRARMSLLLMPAFLLYFLAEIHPMSEGLSETIL